MSLLMSMHGVVKRFRGGGRGVTAVDGVDLELEAAQAVALIGQSGCGKSTLGQLAVGLLAPDSGRIQYGGVDLARCSRRELRDLRPGLQFVFQSPFDAFAPHLSLRGSLEPAAVRCHRGWSRSRASGAVVDALGEVGLEAGLLDRLPDELSGGQLQRASLARALLAGPRLMVADEVVSALDVAAQNDVTRLLRRLQKQWRFALLFITHDLGVAERIADEVIVMDAGRIVERGPARGVIARPGSDAGRRLVEAIPHFPY
ncbi:dipeptide/oligopeptide/nickel ABC transporter ATP-binding protein [uncultured Propionibacterium sp.]|uniref:ABC transporter ATP-binding protein n=1 Tax=uncultured Propionibacterium sp. TaxID=218066 RepID=UPI00292E88F5|nr:dipeptide/oligopeptide/nickel ABC transporter ATP-binding protein [uncultured Propionibacterium sp.]